MKVQAAIFAFACAVAVVSAETEEEQYRRIALGELRRVK